LFVFKGSQEGSAVLFPQKKVTKENSRLRLLLLVLVLLLLVWLPNQTMPVFAVNGGFVLFLRLSLLQ
jgi:hypothetical protein